MAYITTSDVRSITAGKLTTSDISDDDLTTIIGFATRKLNEAINQRVIEEKITYIDKWRENDLDGSNKTFYVQACKERWYLGDYNDDGTIDTNDVVVREYKSDGTYSDLTVSSIDEDDCKFVLETAPESTSILKVSYAKAPLSENGTNAHPLIKQACAELSAALAYTGIQAVDFKRISLGRLSVMQTPKAFQIYMDRYLDTLKQIQYRGAIHRQESEEEASMFRPIQ